MSTTIVRAGKLRALAYFGSECAPEGVTGVQSVTQQGFTQWGDVFGGAFFWTVPAGVLELIHSKLTAWVLDALTEPDVRAALVRVQVNPTLGNAMATDRIVCEMHTVAQGVFGTGTQTAAASQSCQSH